MSMIEMPLTWSDTPTDQARGNYGLERGCAMPAGSCGGPADRGRLLSLRERGLVEIVVGAFLDLEDALGPRLALGDPFQVAEVLESLDPGSDHGGQVGVAGGRGRERVHGAGPNYDQITLVYGQDTVVGEQLCGTRDDINSSLERSWWCGAAPLAPPASMIRWQLSAPPVALLSAYSRPVTGAPPTISA